MTNVADKIPAGSRVVISEFGKHHYNITTDDDYSNPLGVEGTIYRAEDEDRIDGFIYQVQWDDGSWNVYEAGTIELVVKDLTNI